MYNVLHIMAGADGGISAVVLNYYRAVDRTKIHFDIAVTTDIIGSDVSEMEKLGAHIYRIPLKSKGIKAFESALTELLKKENYQAVHVHESETSYVALRIAKKVAIPQRIAHSHTSSPYMSIRSELRRLSGCILNFHYATNVIACGQLAGERVFGKLNMRRKKACVLPNAIDIERYRYSEQERKIKRCELGVENKYVIGMVARLSDEKNHGKALEIMETYHRMNPNAILLCAGSGELEQNLRSQIESKKMGAYVRLLGKRSDVAQLYSAFDVLLLPSRNEGFPMVAVEAISEGLPILLSDTITEELKFSRNVYYLPLTDNQPWLDKLAYIEKLEICDRDRGIDELRNNGLIIEYTAKQLEDIYLHFGEENYSYK